jgi:hypothetical protein
MQRGSGRSVLSQHMPGGTNENFKSYSQRIEQVTSRIQVRSVTLEQNLSVDVDVVIQFLFIYVQA